MRLGKSWRNIEERRFFVAVVGSARFVFGEEIGKKTHLVYRLLVIGVSSSALYVSVTDTKIK